MRMQSLPSDLERYSFLLEWLQCEFGLGEARDGCPPHWLSTKLYLIAPVITSFSYLTISSWRYHVGFSGLKVTSIKNIVHHITVNFNYDQGMIIILIGRVGLKCDVAGISVVRSEMCFLCDCTPRHSAYSIFWDGTKGRRPPPRKKYAESTYVILFTRIGSQESHWASVIRRTRYTTPFLCLLNFHLYAIFRAMRQFLFQITLPKKLHSLIKNV